MKMTHRFWRAAVCLGAVAAALLGAAGCGDTVTAARADGTAAAAIPGIAAIPVVTVPGGRTMIDDIGWYGVSYRYADGRAGSQPMGWTGYFTDDTGIAAMPEPSQDGKSAYLLHPIWRGGTGDTDQTYRLALPKAKGISLAFSIAMGADAVGKSDGVTFRVFVDGKELLDRNKADSTWSDYRFDLSPDAGRTVTLTFETDPGPKDDPSFDFALWGDRRLVCSGAPAAIKRAFRPQDVPLDVKTAGWGSASPTHAVGSDAAARIKVTGGAAPSDLLDGLAFSLDGGKSGRLPFANLATLDLVAPGGKIVSSGSPDAHGRVTQTTPAPGVIRRTAVYTLGGRKITVTAEIDRYDGSSARVVLRSGDPYIAAVHIGRVGPGEFEKPVIVPYYGTVGYLARLGLFSNVVMDYGLSHASRLTDDSAVYAPLTDGTRIKLDETIYYAVSPHFRDVLPTPIGGVSPYRQTMGNVVVVDYWGGDAPGLADKFQDLSTYGLTHFLTIVHDWQHGGYDQQLPAVLPANAHIGGNAGVIALTSKAKSLGAMVALHENYVDFYPNGPLYNVKDVALKPDGSLIPAWSIPGHVSYLLTPVEMHKYAAMVTPLVHSELGTNASYLDVHSATTPFSHTDALATRPGAGMFITTIQATKQLWQYMRAVHGGPVLGEGAAHWYWSGMLDGVEAQFRYGIPQTDGQTAPLFVDFDLLKMHPRQENHGMGYPNRWLTVPHGPMTPSAIDDYNMQEIAYGHSAFGQTESLPYLWEESSLVRPVASRDATANVRAISYEADGALRDTDDAIAAGTDFKRLRVAYDNGLTVYANARPAPWTVKAGGKSFVLPQYGWVASAPGLLAYAAARGGAGAVSFTQTPGFLYANAGTALVAEAALESAEAAPTVDAAPKKMGYAVPEALDFQQTGPRRFQIRISFKVLRQIPPGFKTFVHLVSKRVKKDAGTVVHMPSNIAADPSDWPVSGVMTGAPITVNLPPDLPDGYYDIRVGLYNVAGDGHRLPMTGVDDGKLRYIVTGLTVSGGDSIVASPVAPTSPQSAPVAPQSAPASPAAPASPVLNPVDFGVLATDGSVTLTRRAPGAWTLIPLPRDHQFTVALKGPAIDPAFGRIRAAAVNASGAVVGSAALLPVQGGRSVLTIALPPGAIGYRLTGAPAPRGAN